MQKSNTPPLSDLQPYDAVVVFSNSPFADPVTLGNNLADYQDGGGMVTGLQFDWFGSPFGLDGRWITGGYSPFQSPDSFLSGVRPRTHAPSDLSALVYLVSLPTSGVA